MATYEINCKQLQTKNRHQPVQTVKKLLEVSEGPQAL